MSAPLFPFAVNVKDAPMYRYNYEADRIKSRFVSRLCVLAVSVIAGLIGAATVASVLTAQLHSVTAAL